MLLSEVLEPLMLYEDVIETGLYFGEIWLLYIYLKLVGDFSLTINSEKRPLIRSLATFFLGVGTSTRVIMLLFLFFEMITSMFPTQINYILTLISYLPLLFSMLLIVYLFLVGEVKMKYNKKMLLAINAFLASTGLPLALLSHSFALENNVRSVFLFLIIILSLNTAGVTSIATMFMTVVLKIELYKLVNPIIYKTGIVMLIMFNELILTCLLGHISGGAYSNVFLVLLQLMLLGYTTGVVLISFSITATYDYLKRGGAM